MLAILGTVFGANWWRSPAFSAMSWLTWAKHSKGGRLAIGGHAEIWRRWRKTKPADSAGEDTTMRCPNCNYEMFGPRTSLERTYKHDHWDCDSCGTEVVVPLPDSPDADTPA